LVSLGRAHWSLKFSLRGGGGSLGGRVGPVVAEIGVRGEVLADGRNVASKSGRSGGSGCAG